MSEQALHSQGASYFVDDVHWNQLGHETAARAISKHLALKGIFPFNKQ